MKYSIGEFSQIARVTIKALRLYHEKELLRPDFVDPESGYRYYSDDQVNEARVIQILKEMGFSLAEIKDTLDSCDEDSHLVDRLKEKKVELKKRMDAFDRSLQNIETILSLENLSATEANLSEKVEEKLLPDLLIAGHRMVGHYQEIESGFRLLGRFAGRKAIGKPMCLHYDGDYREEDANFEAAFEVKESIRHDSIDCRVLEGGNALVTFHRGPYERLSESYREILSELKQHRLKAKLPSREVFHKGPGMILRGNPEKYVTEIQILVQ